MTDPLPDTTRPLNDTERTLLAADWSDYRKDYEPSGRTQEYRAFSEGWRAGRTADERDTR